MTALALAIALIQSNYDVKIPDPYLGYGASMNAFKQVETSGTVIARRRKFVNMALPFKVLAKGERDPYQPYYVVVPELAWYNDLIQVNIAGGFEGGWPLGYRSAVSMFWGAQAGFHYSILRVPNYPNEYGTIMSSEDKTSVALLTNFYLGPKFDLNEKYAIRFQINPKVMLGKVAFNSLRTEFFKYMGMSLSFNLQFEFL